ncbi:MAG: response regulator transcription factor [Rubrobacteraceae bacterium]
MEGGRPARLVLADDLDMIRVGIKKVLAREPDLEVVGEAVNGREAVEICRRLEPDLVVMDVQMPEMDGLTATRKIKGQFPTVAVLVLTAYEDPDYLLDAVRAGAAGFVLKRNALLRVTEVVRAVLRAEPILDQGMAMRLLRNLPEAEGKPEQVAEARSQREAAINALTGRELEVLGHIARGYNNVRIAEELVLSVGTVKTHVHRVISKLGVSDRTQAAVQAIRIGLVSKET